MSSNNQLASVSAQAAGGRAAAELLFVSALTRPPLLNNGRLEEMTGTFLAAEKMQVLLFRNVKENLTVSVWSVCMCVFVCMSVF